MARAGEHLEQVLVPSVQVLWGWLAQHHDQTDSVWFVRWKKHVPDKYVSMDDLIDVLLCWGWIDSLPRKLDADRTMVLCAPRRQGSAWSAYNKAKVVRLEAEDRIQPPGAAKIAQARRDDSWSFLDDVEALVQPDDLQAALARLDGAAPGWGNFPKSTKRGLLEWIKTAKRPQTRADRIQKAASGAARGKSPLG